LAGVQEKSIPVGEVGFVASHACEDYATCFSLFLDRSNCLLSPVGVLPVVVGVLPYGYSLGGTEDDATLAVGAVFIPAMDDVVFLVIVVSFIGALVNAYFAANAAILIPFHDIFWGKIAFHG